MLKLFRNALVVLTLGLLMAGCGGGKKAADKLVKDKIVLLNEIAAEFEKVTDKDTMAKARTAQTEPREKLAKIDEQLKALGSPAEDAAVADNKADFDRANDRLRMAGNKAAKVAYGGPAPAPDAPP